MMRLGKSAKRAQQNPASRAPASVLALLMPGENLIFGTTLHWVIYLRGIFVTLLATVLGLSAYKVLAHFLGDEFVREAAKPLAYIILAITLLGCYMLLAAFIRQCSVVLIVTDRRVVAKFGLITRATFEMFLSKVEGANVIQSAPGRILGYGNILIKGVGDSFMPIGDIADPVRFQSALMGQVSQNFQARESK